MVNKLKTQQSSRYWCLTCISRSGCTGNENGESSSQGEETSSEVPGAESEYYSEFRYGSPLAQAEAEEFMLENPDKV